MCCSQCIHGACVSACESKDILRVTTDIIPYCVSGYVSGHGREAIVYGC